MITALSGSMSFAKDFIEIKDLLEKAGHEVIIPANSDNYANGNISVDNKWEEGSDELKKYFHEINRSDALLVINKDKNGIKGYIGGSALIEIAFAHVLGKKIYLFNEMPKMNYTDEIESMNPTIIHADISLIE